MKIHKYFGIAALAAIAVLLPPPPGGVQAATATCPTLVAHMGFHYPYWGLPENSLGAITAASVNGKATWVETDVNMSGGGQSPVPIIMHGAALQYFTNLTGPPQNYTVTQLTAQRLYLVPGTSTTPPSGLTYEHLPTLTAYLARAKTLGEKVEVEESSSWTAAEFAAYIAVMKAAAASTFTTVSGTSVTGLAAVRKAYPGERTHLLVAPFWPLTAAGAGGSSQVDAATGYLTGFQVRAFQAAGVTVDIWTPDTTAAFTIALFVHPNQVTTDALTQFHNISGC